MSKMKMPEMSVVRFTESDVICASMPSSISVKYFNNGVAHDGIISYGGNTYGYGTAPNQSRIWDSILYSDSISIIRPSGNDIHFGNLINTESDAGFSADGVANGTYYWDGDHTYITTKPQ